MENFFIGYMVCWGTACIVAIGLFIYKFKELDIFQKGYWQLLFKPWKVGTFLIAGAGLILIAPYTGDMTWDYIDASFMAVLTYLTAPWVVGVLFKALQGQRAYWQVYVVICTWLFSVSWSYDLYLVMRDGYYPFTWSANIVASSVLYLAAGLLWNLEHSANKGVVFAFMDEEWPTPQYTTSAKKIIGYALPFMLIATVAILSFVW